MPLSKGIFSLVFWIFLWLGFSGQAVAEKDVVSFSDEQLRERYLVLIKELRCPKCQNQNLADSNSMIAEDLRNQVHELLEQDYTDEQITDFMVQRYGDFVRYRPALKASTLLLWLLPVAFLIVILVVPVLLLRRQPKSIALDNTALVSDEEKRLSELLKKPSSEL